MRPLSVYSLSLASSGSLMLPEKAADYCEELVSRLEETEAELILSDFLYCWEDGREELAAFDAEKKLDIAPAKAAAPTACRCGEVITGRLRPQGCGLFGCRCTPEDPVGPCMVSSEGACAAAYKYQTI